MNWLPAATLVLGRALALPLIAALPLFGGLLMLLFRKNPNQREAVSVVAGLITAAAVIGLWPHAGAGLRFELWNWLPGLSLAFELEPLGLIFASVAACLWPVTTVYAIGYMRGAGEKNQTRFYFFFALAISAALGIAFAANGLTLFLFYEVLTLSTYPLVSHKGTPEARRGARIYLAILLTTSIGLLLPAFVWTHYLVGHTDFRLGGILDGQLSAPLMGVLFALYMFGLGKAALMPFHRWLPSAMVAPTPVSALLHAVAVVKAGVFAVLKITIYIFGLETLQITGAAEAIVWVSAFTILAASAIAVRLDNLKARLAYSTVAQLSYIVLGAALAVEYAVLEGALHIITHAAGKITLFFCAGAIYVAHHKTKVSELDGLGQRMPFTFGAFALASVSIIGLPPLAGAWDKFLLLEGSVEAGMPVLIGVLLVASVLSLFYLAPIPVRAFLLPPRGTAAVDDPSGDPPPSPRPPLAEAPWACVVPLCLTALACLLLFFVEDQLLVALATRLGGAP